MNCLFAQARCVRILTMADVEVSFTGGAVVEEQEWRNMNRCAALEINCNKDLDRVLAAQRVLIQKEVHRNLQLQTELYIARGYIPADKVEEHRWRVSAELAKVHRVLGQV